jgi:spore germination protein GerM
MRLSTFRTGTHSLAATTSAAVIASVIVIASCGVQTGPNSLEGVDEKDVPNRLADPSTTTSTTTTSTTSVPETSEPAIVPASTVPPAETQPVKIYFLSQGRLRPVEYEVGVPAQPSDLVNELASLLEGGPVGPSADLLDNVVPAGLFNDDGFTTENFVLTIDLSSQIFQEIEGRPQQREAIAQIVYTFVGNLVGVIGSVRFTLDAEPLIVPDGEGISTDQPVSIDDYQNMLIDVGPPDTQPPPGTQPPPETLPPDTPTETSAPPGADTTQP